MAITAVYVSLTHISLDHSASRESFVFNNIGTTTAPFTLMGGEYGIICKASAYGTVTLKVLSGDLTNYVTAATAISADGTALVVLPAGVYVFALAA